MDINETIIDYLNTQITSVHIGETVPQETTTNYIWIQRQGDTLGEQLNWPPVIESVLFDFECVSLDIDESRTLTDLAKEEIRNCPMHSLIFESSVTHSRRIQSFDVEDHGDDYLSHSIQQDKDLHMGAFRVTAYLSDPFLTPE